MNTRILELIKNPQLIQKNDLDILKSEISSYPYLQSVRAIHLLATSKFDGENYHKSLSTTAAFTTDKKILYQLINGKIKDAPVNLSIVSEIDENSRIELEEKKSEIISEPENIKNSFTEEIKQDEEPVNKVDILEKKTIEKQILEENPGSEILEIQTKDEAIMNEDSLLEDTSIISFQGTTEFLPEIKIVTGTQENQLQEPPKFKENRYEEEMRRLIEEVERKMKENKANKSSEIIKEEENISSEVSFAETMDFETSQEESNHEIPEKQIIKENLELVTEVTKKEIQKPILEIKEQEKEVNEVVPILEKNEWKPMNFLLNQPDSTIQKNEEKPIEIKDKATETKINTEPETDIPVINVSFFAPNVSEIKTPETPKTQTEENMESNIPQFINTWQSWLKINRSEPPKIEQKPEVSKEEIKEKAIEKFIETEPKISQLRDENNFVIKEKKGGISHLMTETLAKLYTEQKLYSKAIKAYETLSQKHPDKAEYFTEKILKIKELRTNNQ